MSLDVWFTQDIGNTIAALHTANRATIARLSESPHSGGGTRDTRHLNLYAVGYTDTLRAVAVAFGVAPNDARLNGDQQLTEGSSDHD